MSACSVILYFSNHFNLSVYVSSHYIVVAAAAVISDYSLFSLFRQSACLVPGSCVCLRAFFFCECILPRWEFVCLRIPLHLFGEYTPKTILFFLWERSIYWDWRNFCVSLLLITALTHTVTPFLSSSSAFCFQQNNSRHRQFMCMGSHLLFSYIFFHLFLLVECCSW